MPKVHARRDRPRSSAPAAERKRIAREIVRYRHEEALTQAELAAKISVELGREIGSRSVEVWERAQSVPSGDVMLVLVRLGAVKV